MKLQRNFILQSDFKLAFQTYLCRNSAGVEMHKNVQINELVKRNDLKKYKENSKNNIINKRKSYVLL